MLKLLDEKVNAEITRTRRAALMPILEALRKYVIDYAEKRRTEGRAEFQDLLVWARDLLRDNLEVRDHFRNVSPISSSTRSRTPTLFKLR